MKLQERVIRTIEEQAAIDEVADPVQRAVRAVLDRAPRLEAFLHGEQLGHPLHAALVSVPIGAFATALVLDAMELTGKGRRYRRAADVAITMGVAGAAVAMLPGLADWSLTRGAAKRVGFVHAAMNQGIAGLFIGSLIARSRGKRRAGIALSTVGFALLGASAWLGGELAYRYGVGVRREADRRPREPVAEARGGARP